MRLVGEHEVLESVFVEMDPVLDGFSGVLLELCGNGGELRAPGDRGGHRQPPPETHFREPRSGLRALRGRARLSGLAPRWKLGTRRVEHLPTQTRIGIRGRPGNNEPDFP